MTKNCRRRLQDLVIDGKLIMTNAQIEDSIIGTASFMDHYRKLLGNKPIKVTSWYRPTSVNARVGVRLWSRNQYGDGVDWISYYYSNRDIAKILEAGHTNGGYKAY